MDNDRRFRGTVQQFNNFGGRGTIVMHDGREVSVRYSAILGDGVRRLEKGASVSFQIEESQRGLVAVRVQPE